MNRYHHVQKGVTLFAIYGVLIVITLLLIVFAGVSQLLVALVALGLAMAAFATLEIAIDDSEIVAQFYLGFPRRRIALADVSKVTTVRNRWYYGLGVRYTPHGWLFSDSGHSAVKIECEAEGDFVWVLTSLRSLRRQYVTRSMEA